MYLNTGLTSTKNYGKTILTKVRRCSVCVFCGRVWALTALWR